MAPSCSSVGPAAHGIIDTAGSPPLQPSSPGHLASPSAVVSSMADNRRVLVLGMAFVTASFSSHASLHTSKQTSNPYQRDRSRLMCLQAAGYDVLTMSADREEAVCEVGRHCQARFTRRGTLDLCRRFASSWAPLSAVCMDYFRFPGEYMRQAYAGVFREVLPCLYAQGMIDQYTTVYAPYLDNTFLLGLHPLLATHSISAVIPVSAEHNPLYTATSHTAQQQLGDFTNASQIQQLLPHSPFVAIRWTERYTTSQHVTVGARRDDNDNGKVKAKVKVKVSGKHTVKKGTSGTGWLDTNNTLSLTTTTTTTSRAKRMREEEDKDEESQTLTFSCYTHASLCSSSPAAVAQPTRYSRSNDAVAAAAAAAATAGCSAAPR